MDQNASQLKLTDANIGQFLNFFLEQHEGGMPSELDLEDNSEPEGTFSEPLKFALFVQWLVFNTQPWLIFSQNTSYFHIAVRRT